MVEEGEVPQKKSDAELKEEVKELLSGHGDYFTKHEGLYEQHVTKPHIAEGKTIGEKIDDIAAALEKVLEEYLSIVGIEGTNAKDYLSDLSLTAQDLKEQYRGRLGRLFDTDIAVEIRERLKNQLSEKLRQILTTKVRQMKDMDEVHDLLNYVVEEAGTEDQYTPGGLEADVKDQTAAAGIVAQHVDPITRKYINKAKHQGEEYQPEKA